MPRGGGSSAPPSGADDGQRRRQRPRRRLRAAWLVALAAAGLCASPAAAIDAKCSACSVVAGELRRVLDSEKPRDPIDLRGRLDSKGVRYGKVIDFKMSELRVIELLDGLCDALSNFALWTPSAAWVTANPEADHDRRWVRITGAGADVQGATDESLKGAKGKTMGKEIQSYCARLVEVHEEELTAAVRAEGFNSTATEGLLCRRLTNACKNQRLRKPAPPAAAAGEAAPAEAKEEL